MLTHGRCRTVCVIGICTIGAAASAAIRVQQVQHRVAPDRFVGLYRSEMSGRNPRLCGREDIIPEMFRRLVSTLYGAKLDNDQVRNFIYYMDRHIELDGDSHGPKGRELLDGLIANSPHNGERALKVAASKPG